MDFRNLIMTSCENDDCLLAQIFNAFVTSDDTGICELAMTSEARALRRSGASLAKHPLVAALAESGRLSPEIREPSDGFGFRRRSEATFRQHQQQQQPEQLQQQQELQLSVTAAAARRQRFVRVVSSGTVEAGDVSSLFVKRCLVTSPDLPANGDLSSTASLAESQLTRSLRQTAAHDNTFAKYLKFDGRAQISVPTRRIKVFIYPTTTAAAPPAAPAAPAPAATPAAPPAAPAAPAPAATPAAPPAAPAPAATPAAPPAAPTPAAAAAPPAAAAPAAALNVVCLSSATVSEAIGFICWLYTSEQHQPPLSRSVDDYCLCMAEDDGVVDADFPPLSHSEPIGKFGFTVLALTPADRVHFQIEVDEVLCDAGTVFVSLHRRLVSVLQVILSASSQITLADTIKVDSLCVKCLPADGAAAAAGGGAVSPQLVTPDTDLCQPQYRRLLLTRHASVGVCFGGGASEDCRLGALICSVAATVYQSFRVNRVKRIAPASPVQLGVSVDCVTVDPLSVGKARSLLSHTAAVTYRISSVADCSMTNVKYGGRAVFRLLIAPKHANRSHKRLDFECDIGTAKVIVKKVLIILDFVNSESRRQYMESGRSRT